MEKLEIISVDLSNYCTKACSFCYNDSNPNSQTSWDVNDFLFLADDCINNEVKAFSIGGGEPFEYTGIFKIISHLAPKVFLSITSNGLPLLNQNNLELLLENQPHKIHFTIHFPEKIEELRQVLNLIEKLEATTIKTGVNLLVSSSKIEAAKQCASDLQKQLSSDRIIYIPQKYEDMPTPQQIAYVAGGGNFQSPSCLVECKPSKRFCSIGYDKKVGLCSYSSSRIPLKSLSFQGIIEALNRINFTTCMSII